MRKQYVILDRLLAYIYDIIFIGLSLFITIIGFEYLNTKLFQLNHFIKDLTLVIFCIGIYLTEFTIISIYLKGTIGKYLTDLKIVSTSGKITFGRMLFREVILKHLFYLTIIGFIIECVFYFINKQTIHDYFLKTSVEYKEIKENKRRSQKIS